jgi:protein-tyrosine phosphatase
MMPSVNKNLEGSKTNGSQRYRKHQYVDIHCHCLPAVDDGPASMSDAIALCLALVDDKITTIIATPHQLGRFDGCNEAAQTREAVTVLNEELKSNSIPLTILPGGDIRVDERICQLLKADKILTLADGGKYILLELPHEHFIDIEPLLIELSSMGIQTIISHPERHHVLAKQPKILHKWLKHSTHLQVTTSSLLGEFGSMPFETAWYLLSSGLAGLVATDSHDLNRRRPCMTTAFERICKKLGRTIARVVCVENPLRVLEGRDIVSSDDV